MKKQEDKIVQAYKELMELVSGKYAELNAKIWRRCMIEGCRFGYEGFDKEPADNCIYCGEERRYMYPENLVSIRKSLEKVRPKHL